jgi:hypothetical protein
LNPAAIVRAPTAKDSNFSHRPLSAAASKNRAGIVSTHINIVNNDNNVWADEMACIVIRWRN